MDRYAIADINRVLNFLASIEGTDFATEEFTAKEFNQTFRGTRSNPAQFSLDWLREYGVLDGRVRFRPWSGRENFRPFIIVSRVEDFELPFKEEPWRGYEKTEVLKDSNGNIVNADLNAYKTDVNYREFIESKYGVCTLETVEKKTFTAHRNFYKVDLEALKSVRPRIEEMREYYEEKLEKARAEVKKYEKALDLIK